MNGKSPYPRFFETGSAAGKAPKPCTPMWRQNTPDQWLALATGPRTALPARVCVFGWVGKVELVVDMPDSGVIVHYNT